MIWDYEYIDLPRQLEHQIKVTLAAFYFLFFGKESLKSSEKLTQDWQWWVQIENWAW